jgi:hypothetical protein
MHQKHRSFRAPTNPHVPTWRYMDFAKFVDLLETRHLWFSRLDKMPDPWEGALSPASLPVIERWIRDRHTDVTDEAEVIRRRDIWAKDNYTINQLMTYVSCWHMNEHESMAMWNLYSGRGIAVRSTYLRLCQSFGSVTEPEFVGEVDYIDYRTQAINPGNTFNAALCKRMSFVHERELRAVVERRPPDWTSGRPDHEKYAKSQPPGVSIAVDLDTLIEGVIVSPGRPGWFGDLVERVMRTYGLRNRTVETSGLDERPDLI